MASETGMRGSSRVRSLLQADSAYNLRTNCTSFARQMSRLTILRIPRSAPAHQGTATQFAFDAALQGLIDDMF